MTLLHFYIVIYPAACICILAGDFQHGKLARRDRH